MTNKQRRALRRERARANATRAKVQRSTAVNMQTVRAGEHTHARERQDRFEVDLTRTWYVIRTLPRWASRAAEQIRGIGIPVFEAREAVRLVSDIGKVRVALIPVMRRLIFVGVSNGDELRAAERHPGVYDDATGFRSTRTTGAMTCSAGRVMTIAPEDLQNFADCITGYGGEMDRARKLMLELGQVVRVTRGPFASFRGKVEEIDERTGCVKVAVDIFGRETPVQLEYQQVEAA